MAVQKEKRYSMRLLASIGGVMLIGALVAIGVAQGSGNPLTSGEADEATESAPLVATTERRGAAVAVGMLNGAGGDPRESEGAASVFAGETPEEDSAAAGDESTDLLGDATAVTSRERDGELIEAVIETSYRCPLGSEGTAGSSGAGCVSSASEQTNAITETSYRCPSGSSGSPTESNPTCEGSETVAAVATGSTYSCPPGSGGTPTVADPYCIVTGEIQVEAALDTTYSCPPGASEGHALQGNEPVVVCRQTIEVVQELSPAAQFIYSCEPPARGKPTADDPTCIETVPTTVYAAAVEVIGYECPQGSTESGGPPTHALDICYVTLESSRPVEAVAETTYRCPPRSTGTPSAADLSCQAIAGAPGDPQGVPVIVLTSYSCPEGSTGNPTFGDPYCIETSTTEARYKPNQRATYQCPDGFDGAPGNRNDQCVDTSGFKDQVVPAKEVTDFYCPSGSVPDTSSSTLVCLLATEVAESVEQIESTSYSCPTGSDGSPSTADPYCRELTSETIAAEEVAGYACPSGYDATGPVGVGTECVGYRSVPAIVADVDYRCPDGASGSPSAADPTCTWTTTEPVEAVEETSYSCPAGSSGQPSASDPHCFEDAAQ